jgi:hypothetical protein
MLFPQELKFILNRFSTSKWNEISNFYLLLQKERLFFFFFFFLYKSLRRFCCKMIK